MMRIDKILCDIVAIEHGFQHILDGANARKRLIYVD